MYNSIYLWFSHFCIGPLSLARTLGSISDKWNCHEFSIYLWDFAFSGKGCSIWNQFIFHFLYFHILTYKEDREHLKASHQGSTYKHAGRCKHTCNYLGGRLRGTGTVACTLAPSFFPPMGNLLERIGPRQIRFTRAVQFPREMYVSWSAIFLLWASAISCQSCTAGFSSAFNLRFLLMPGFCGSLFCLRPLLCAMGSLSFRLKQQQYHLHPQGHTQSSTLVCLLQ